MTKVINLNRFRKAKDKRAAKKQADTNRALYGQTKSEKQKQRHQSNLSNKNLDQHKLETDD